MIIKSARLALLGILCAALSASCVSMEYGVELDRDLSGTLDFSVTMDVDQMAYSTAMMQRMFQGKEGEPTEEEIQAAREEVRAELQSQREEFELEDVRRKAREDLPEGVELVDARQSEDGLQTELTFEFDHVRRLSEMEISAEADTADASSVPSVEPFGGLQFRDEGDTFTLTNTPVNPMEQAQSEGSPVQGMAPQMKMMMRSMSGAFSGPMVTFFVTAPFEVVEHNATRVSGNTLYWEYGLETFLEEEQPAPIRAKFRKP